jgi:outer membrane lipoprotein-sorting protein
MLRKLALIVVCAALAPMAAGAQTVDEVIARNIQAHGGLEKLKSVNAEKMTAKFTAGSFRADVLQINKRPGKVRQEFIIQGLAQVTAYDGTVGWRVNPFEGRKDPDLLSHDDTKDLEVSADIDGPLVDYAQKGHKAELVGHDSVEGTDCYKIKLTLKNGDIRYYYLDTDSFLELKVETQTTVRGTIQEGETYYGDYEQVQGIYFPFAIESGQKGDTSRVKIAVDKIELNVPLDDSLFAVPVAKPAAKASGN